MPSTEKLTRLGIFLATGYLCAGIVVAIFVGLPLWVNFFSSEFYIGALITIVTMLVAAVIGVGIMRALVSRYGLKPIFDMDVLILMIGVLFLALAMNQAMVVVGLLVTIGGGTLYFIENFSVQIKAASQGGTKALSLVGWALGPIIAVAALTIFADHGLLTLRILLAHYIVIAFWVWVQRLSLHEDYAEAPEFLHRMYESYQHLSAIRAEQDLEIKKNRFARFADKVKAPEPKATPAAQAAPVAAPAAQAAPVEPKAAQAAPTKPAAPKAESVGLTVESVMAAPKAEPEAPQAAPEAPKAEEVKPAEESKPAAQAPQAEVAAESPKAEDKPAEESKTEAPKAEDKPAEESKAGAPKAEDKSAEESKTEAPKAEDKPAEESKAEAPKAEDKPAEESKAETEAPKAEDKPAEEQPAETPKKKKGWLW